MATIMGSDYMVSMACTSANTPHGLETISTETAELTSF